MVGERDEHDVEQAEEEQQRGDAEVEEQRDVRTALHEVHPVLGQPVKALQKEEQREECDELRVQIVAEHGERQTGLGDRVPGAFDQVLGLRRPQFAEEDESEQFADEQYADERLQVDDRHAAARSGDVDHRRVELFLLVERVRQHAAGQRNAGQGDQKRLHFGWFGLFRMSGFC